MIHYAVRRACATSLRQGGGGLSRWRAPACRLRSAGTFAVSYDNDNTPADPTTINSSSSTVSAQQQEQGQQGQQEQGGAEAASLAEEHGEGSSEYMFDRRPATLGRDVGRMVRLGQDVVPPELVDLMVSASTRSAAGSPRPLADTDTAGVDVFAVIAKAYHRLDRHDLTLQLCEAFEESTGKPLVPSTPEGLLWLLRAIRRWRRTAAPRYGRRPMNRKRDGEGERAVKEVLRRYEEGGKEVPAVAYKAAVLALDGGRCTVALEIAQEARSKLGDSAEGLGEVYAAVMKQCLEQLEPDVMRDILEERRQAGGTMAPDARAYDQALGCLGKARRVSEALELFGEMLESGVKPTAISINHMLSGCARDADKFWRHANTIFEGMEQRWGVAPNVFHYTSLVTCLLKAGQWSEAIAMTDRMEGEGIPPNSRFLDHMMQASVGAKQWVMAEAIFRAMTEKYGYPNVVSRQSTMNFIQSMVMQKKLRKVISYVARIQDFYFSLDGPSRSSRSEGGISTSTMDAAILKWFRTIPGVTSEAMAGVLMTMLDKGVRLNPDSYSIVISKANQDGNKELSGTIYKMLVAANGGPSLSAANAAIKGCATIDEALATVESLREQGLSPDKFTYAALLHCCSTAVGDDLQGERATEASVWDAMYGEGICPHGGMLAKYLLALMRSGDWKTALDVRERYLGDNEEFQLSHAERHVHKLDFVAREEAVVDGVVANGLVDNKQPDLALAYVLEVLKARKEEGASGNGGHSDLKHFIDEDNHTVLAGIRACKQAGSCETAMGLLEACEARWARGPLERDAGRGDGGEEGQWAQHEWREMLVRTRLSRRRLYDCLVSVLDEKDHDFGGIRRVLERGMRNGAVSLMKDQQGGTSAEQAVDFHGWSTRSARCIVRCIIEDLTLDQDFLHRTGQYDLGRATLAQGLREFGNVSDRWHVDSPDPRGRRREFFDGVTPARFAEREYGKGRKRNPDYPSRRVKRTPEGGWDGRGSDESQARWWEKQKRLSLVVGKPRPPPCIRNAVEEFCMLGVSPPLRVQKAASNPGILTIEPEDVRAWLERNPRVLA
ncbi:unnamed protein product [Ectocarpus fasciculatus]